MTQGQILALVKQDIKGLSDTQIADIGLAMALVHGLAFL